MNALAFGEYLRRLRKNKKLTIRQLDTYSGVSNSYISQMERGERGIPSPEILKKLSKPLGVDYEELMRVAGYIDENKEESEYALSEDEFSSIVREIEEEYKVNLHDNPIAHEAVRQSLDIIARMIKDKK